MTLLETVSRLDNGGYNEVYDPGTGCYVSRDSEGEITLVRDTDSSPVTATLKELVSGPCRGHRGAALDKAIREEMNERSKAVSNGDDETVEIETETDEEAPIEDIDYEQD